MGSQTSTQKVNIEKLDTSVNDWIKATGFINKDRTRNFSILRSIKENERCICNKNWDSKKTGNCKQIIVEKRIGSHSMAGEAYMIDIDGKKAVAKLMPILDKKSDKENKNEIMIAVEASNLVFTGKSQFFPLVYAVSECTETVLNSKSSFYNRAKSYAIREHIENQLNEKRKKRFMALSLNKESLEEIVKVSMDQRGGQLVERPNTDYKVRSNVIIDELAWGDLGQYIIDNKSKMNNRMWNLILLQVLSGIDDMQTMMSVVHHDLHQGNVLLSFHQDGESQFLICLIHDFGKSGKVQTGEWTKEDRINDVEVFFNAMSKSAPPEMVSKMDYVANIIIENHQDGSPIMSKILNYWKKN
jgi:predicted DNA-binding protein